ncbi:probable trehalose-phosphate phosphatase E [Andrographis paniculata]|uniref:probable trehalose-phosphate phosphatase E n=1 Tax=Andrographis paniculata TaxID=175694 RepID=UPI0021E98BEF|nr:probable trehalose-phosphate phosphatase E [Andrographis paniculata]
MSTQTTVVTISSTDQKRVMAPVPPNIVISDATVSMAAIAVAAMSDNYFSSVKRRSRDPTCCRNNRIAGKASASASAAALLDSMRASSPTRTSAAEDHKSWILRHPSALAMFDGIMAASIGKQIVVFLDYDGTLSPIVDDPDRAFITSEMREAVRNVAKFFPTAIVSGRCRAKVYSFVRLSELYYAGSHGMDIKGPARGNRCRKGNQSLLCQPAREFLPMIDEINKALMERVGHIAGAKVENNKFCLSVHYRCVEEKQWGELAEQVKLVIKDYPRVKLSQGRKVLEIRPVIEWDKGNALEFLLESLGYAESDNVLPVYIGDDRTDEDAFKVLRERGQGLGILVSKNPKETNASYSLQEPIEVMEFLKRLVEWKKLSCGCPYRAISD